MTMITDSEATTKWSVAALGFAIIFLDGFDTALLPLLLPTLSPLWHVEPKAFAVPLTITNIGAVAGFVASGWLASRFDPKRVLVFGCAWFGVWTLLTGFILHLQSMPLLASVRLLTGFGLGVVLPTAIGLATRHGAKRHQATISVLVTLGLGTGAAVCGFLGGMLVRNFGPEGCFLFGGIFPLLVAALAQAILPASPAAENFTRRDRNQAGLAELFEPNHRWTTILLWVFSFSIFVAYYTLSNWIPALLIGFGFAPTEAPLGLGFFSIGAVVGGIALLGLVRLFDIRPLLVLMCAVSAAFIVLLVKTESGHGLLLAFLAGAGFGIVAGQIGQLTLAVLTYPEAARTTGVGWAAALGRCGSIVGPAVGGALLSLGLDGKSIVLAMLVPLLLAGAIAAILWNLDMRSKPTEAWPKHVDIG